MSASFTKGTRSSTLSPIKWREAFRKGICEWGAWLPASFSSPQSADPSQQWTGSMEGINGRGHSLGCIHYHLLYLLLLLPPSACTDLALIYSLISLFVKIKSFICSTLNIPHSGTLLTVYLLQNLMNDKTLPFSTLQNWLT